MGFQLPPFKWPLNQQQWELVYRKLTTAAALIWDQVDKTGSSLSDLTSRAHSQLTDILGWSSGGGTAKDKHISQADGKVWQDHATVNSHTHHGFDHDTVYELKNTNIQAHIIDTANPHETTAAQTGAYTIAETATAISTAIADLVDSSPATLDTLNELATALGDDPNFAATVAASIGNKAAINGDNTEAFAADTLTTADIGATTAESWRLGTVKSGVALTVMATSYVEIEINGVVVKLAQIT